MHPSPARPPFAAAFPFTARNLFALGALVAAAAILALYVNLLNESVARGVQWREDARSAAQPAAKRADRRLASGLDATPAGADPAQAATRRQ